MGMFDEVTYNGKEYQTKDFDKCLERFRISDNNIEKEVVKRERVEENDFGLPKIKTTHVKWTKISFHGILHIYNEKDSLFLKFTDGNLISVDDNCEYLKELREHNEMFPV